MLPREQWDHRRRAAGGRRDDGPLKALVPGDFRLAFDAAVRRPRPDVLIGGAPLRVLRLTPKGAKVVDAWEGGKPVEGARALATRLVEAGIAHPCPPAMDQPRVAIVIPVRDDEPGLNRTMQALDPNLDVIVVDDASARPVTTRATLVRREAAGGPGSARNDGWRRAASAEVVVFVDAGCEPSPGWLDTLLPHFADPALAAVAPRIVSRPGPSLLARYEEHRSPLDLGRRAAPVRPHGSVPYVPTAVLAVRRKALDELDGFDETLRFGEDVDFVWRLYERGWRVRYEPAAEASHPPRSSWGGWIRQRFDYGRSAAPLAARHGRAVAPLTVSPWSAAAWAFLAAGQLTPAAGVVVGSSAALSRRAGSDNATANELMKLAAGGHLRAGASLARAIRRAWLPPATFVFTVAWRKGGRKLKWALAFDVVAIFGTGLAGSWSDRRDVDPLTWAACRLVDDLAYQAGVWAGVWRQRSAAALLPDW